MKVQHLTLLVLCLVCSPASSRNPLRSLLGSSNRRQQQDHNDDHDKNDVQYQQPHNRDHRRRLMETSSTGGLDDIYMDAATGTVPRMLTQEEKASKKAAQEAGTCDGQMAIALVKANEKQAEAETERDVAIKERTEALEKIITLQSLLVQLESKLEVERSAHKDDNQESARILKETQENAEREQNLLKEEKANALKLEKEQAQTRSGYFDIRKG